MVTKYRLLGGLFYLIVCNLHPTVVVVITFRKKGPSCSFQIMQPRVRWIMIKAAWREFLLRCTPWPVYFYRYSRDCDLMECEWYDRFPNGWTAIKAMDDSYENAEGPERWARVSRSTYQEYANYFKKRDIAAEQMNY